MDNRVTTNMHIFFSPVPNLAQKAKPSEYNLFRSCFTIITRFQSIIFLHYELGKKTLKLLSYFEKGFLLIYSSRILGA